MSLLKQARKNAGLSITEASKKLGIPEGYLSQIENGHRQVSSERADQIAKLYSKKVEDIFFASRYAIREVETTA